MNVHDPKRCQTDGFDLKHLGLTLTKKGNDKQTLLWYVLNQMKEDSKAAGEEIKSIKHYFSECYACIKSNIEVVEREIEDLMVRLGERKIQYHEIACVDASLSETPFG
jgi:hypothetical protein